MNLKPLALSAALLTLTGCGKEQSDVVPVMKAAPDTSQSASTDTTAAGDVSTATADAETAETTSVPPTTLSEPPADLVLTCKDSVEVYSEQTIYSILTAKNVSILNGEDKIDTSSLGAHEITVRCSDDGMEFETPLTYEVVDTTAPILLNSGNGSVHLAGKGFDLGDYVGFADNYDKSPSLTYSGDIDPNTPGSYALYASVTDSSGNETSWDLTINVSDSVPDTVFDSFGMPFSDFVSQYGGDGKRLGIDVSAWQGDIDFEAVKNAGCEFVMIRVGYCYDEEETPTLDDWFFSNISEAQAAGLDTGIYYYSADNTPEKLAAHTEWILQQLEGRSLSLPAAFDWEEFGNFQQYGMSIHDLNELYSQFSETMRAHGFSSMLYSSKNFLNNFWTEETKSLDSVWLAHFVEDTDYTGEYAMWQVCSAGTIDGIDGYVDFDIMYS